MSEQENQHLTVSAKGDDAMTGAVLAAAAMIDLFAAAAEELAPGSDVRLSVASMGWACDRCGKQVGVERPESWTRDGADDLCDECSEAVAARNGEKPT